MEDKPGLFGRLEGALEKYTDRERRLLMIMAIIVPLMLVTLIGSMTFRSLGKLNDKIEDQRAVLSDLFAERVNFVESQLAEEALNEQLENNNLQLASFIEARANDAGVARPRNFRDQTLPLGEGGIEEVETTTTFTDMTPADLDNLMVEILTAPELVYVRRLTLAPGRGRDANGLQVELTLVTYRRSGGS